MNFRVTDPEGVDVPIDKIQKRIYDKLVALWGVLDVYGRVSKKDTEDGIQIARYIGGGEYEPMLFTEGNKIFFLQGNSPKFSLGNASNDVWMICILNVDQIRNLDHRGDEEVHKDLISVLSDFMKLSDIETLEYGMDNLARIVEESFVTSNFRYSDIHPYHVFQVKFNLKYNLLKYPN